MQTFDSTTPPRALSTLELLGLLDDASATAASSRAEVRLDVAVVDGGTVAACAPVAFHADRGRALDALAALGDQVVLTGNALSCVTGVEKIEVRVKIDGDDVLATEFPLRTLPRIAEQLDRLLTGLGAFEPGDGAHFEACAALINAPAFRR